MRVVKEVMSKDVVILLICLIEIRLLKNYSWVTLNPDIHQDKLREESILITNPRYFASLNMTITNYSEVSKY